MVNRTFEPNAQNSELDPEKHPSGARIERMIDNANRIRDERLSDCAPVNEGKGRYTPSEDPVEGARGDSSRAPHRMNPDHREQR